jgi:hypothetical protein
MSTRREDDSRPKSNATSQRQTARDVPLAKYKEVPVGTSPPGALRGPSLLPGQGAPERIVPEEIELAVLRDAETLDGPHVARVTAKRQQDLSSSPSPMPVSVEVPRARSLAPLLEELSNTPPAPSARSIQSGTLMSIGSVDPRAPTELSLPSPRPLSVSERAAYFGPEAVVDRSIPPTPAPAPSSRALPLSAPSARPPSKRDSSVPPAQNFARPPRAYAPPSRALEPPPPPSREPQSSQRPVESAPSRRAQLPPSYPPEVAPRFQIHSEIEALNHELNHESVEDNFDLRSAHTQREPLASRKAQPSSDWLTVHAPSSAPPAIELRSPATRSSTSAITLLVDRDRDRAFEPARSGSTRARRAAVPVTWLFAGLCALLVLLLAIWIARAPTAQDSAHVPDDRATASAPSAAPLLVPPSAPEPAAVVGQVARPRASSGTATALPRTASGGLKVSAPSGAHSAELQERDAHDAPPPVPVPADSSAKSHQSIY